ncbi:Crp/Fnr family transcriptional regulator [Micromonospora endolithica]|uniref:Crp/Fnr family transcriptional regulator n=1 Tax=Micromonospora endolithica TaxID=230091 RepID=A0A3A9ZJA4_9ACTN|nr:Crp/Fnr family transcriptional regulator [Micromonospora endolithica]RKN48413.1 Crp/Fnr family transcriptional regulator [Micromonospora endolithica]
MNAPAGDQLRAALSAEEIAELNELGIPVTFQPGAVIFKEGERSNHAVLIKRGHVKVVSATHADQELVLAMRGPNEVVGEMAPLDGRPRSATVVAATPVEAAIVSAEDFNTFLDAHPRVLRFLLTQIMQRLREADHGRVDLATLSVTARVAACLLELGEVEAGQDATEESAPVVVRVSQNDISAYVGATREAVAKAMGSLRRDGLIKTGYRQIRVINREALAALAQDHNTGHVK